MSDILIKERPIIYGPESVLAIMEGRKTQTRRVVKWEPYDEGFNLSFSGLSVGYFCTDLPSSGFVLYSRRGDGCWEQRTKPIHCPYGVPGDRLWVRETHALFKGTSTPSNIEDATYCCYRDGSQVFRKGGYFPDHRPFESAKWPSKTRWRSPIHMPRWASRIILEITEVRVERLQAISKADVIAEGFYGYDHHLDGRALDNFMNQMIRHAKRRDPLATGTIPIDRYAAIWDRINRKRFPWASNPWVWAITF